MSNEQRESPETFLKKIKLESEETTDKTQGKGSLKIFLGYCAGVGKTYKMLQQAGADKLNGEDIVVGVVETHGRSETQGLLKDLEIVPRRTSEYKGLALQEMDIDAVLKRKPHIVLVDELAHTNVPGSRHLKRFQDVEELVNAGVNVYTTLNIQHVESLIDIVHEITGVTVQETVPNAILEMADIELIDLTPEELQERLRDGKVYIPQKAEMAAKKFFKKGNLLALRELALRYTAKQVDEDVRTYMQKTGNLGPLPAGARIMIGISSSPTSERLIRLTHRMASDLDAEWFVAHVESPQQVKKTSRSLVQLDKNIKLAEELGANFVSLSGNNIANEISAFAKKNNITLIMAGLSQRSKLQEFVSGSVLNELVKKAKPINVLIVNDDVDKKEGSYEIEPKKGSGIRSYLLSLLGVAATVGIGWLLRSTVEPVNIGMLLLLPVVVSGILWGTRVSFVSSVVAVACFDVFFIPPYLTFRVDDIKYLPSFGVFIFISVIISLMAKLVRWQVERLRYRENFLSSLFSFSREIIAAKNTDEILLCAGNHIFNVFATSVVILIPDEKGNLSVGYQKGENGSFDESEKAISTWSFRNGKKAGRDTETLPAGKYSYHPLIIKDKPVGVVGLRGLREGRYLTSEQIRLLESFCSVVALALSKSGPSLFPHQMDKP